MFIEQCNCCCCCFYILFGIFPTFHVIYIKISKYVDVFFKFNAPGVHAQSFFSCFYTNFCECELMNEIVMKRRKK